MKTYVKIEFNNEIIDKKFDTLDDAVFYVEMKYNADKNDILNIYVYYDDDVAIEHQASTRNPYSGDLIYYSWGIYGENFFEGSDRVYNSEILAECINSEEETIKIAETIRDKFEKFDRVTIASYAQSVWESFGYSHTEITIYERGESND